MLDSLALAIECFLLLLLTVVFKKVNHYCIVNSYVYVYSINKTIGTASNKFAHFERRRARTTSNESNYQRMSLSLG